ncbi:MAG: flagellar motor protein MotB [Bacteroidia bacterium]
MTKILVGILAFSFMTSGCVSRKKYNKQSEMYETLKKDCGVIESNLQKCLDESGRNSAENTRLAKELADLKANSTTMLHQLSNMSVINSTQAESIRKSLENINSKDSYIKDLQTAMAHKDSLNMALVLNLKGALKDVNDEDVTVNVEGSAVFISISDKMLFSSGSYNITPRAKSILGKVADVIKAQPEVQFMVEGHTDNKAISTGAIKDNWDLSVMRATSVVRVLHKSYGVDPARMIAAGRSEYVPLTSNASTDGRSLNRRTRIVILPQLDQFFKMLEPK